MHSVNFNTVGRIEVTSPEFRRFITRVFQRYVEINTTFARPRFVRFLPGMRAHAARTASQVQRNLMAHLERNVPSFGAPRNQLSWSGVLQHSSLEHDETEHNTRVLEATLLRRAGDAPGPYVPLGRRGAPSPQASAKERQGQSAVPPQPNRSASMADATVPVSAKNPPSSQALNPSGSGNVRDIPADLLQLYGAYLSDMQPEVYSASPQRTESPFPSAPPGARPANGYQSPGVSGITGMPQATAPSLQYGTSPEDARSDKLIFWQLRYQLEAYIRRATRSYGVLPGTGDPFGVLDTLRRSGFVDESDLQIAEGILALTDKVTAAGSATLDDYRKAFMLYLLYHRSHLGG
ncbi:MAG: hypothetical protein ACLQUY_21810 [Ktedonobacterales bacterium]